MNEAVVNAALAQWGMSGASVSLVAARENSVYRVECSEACVALRLHRPGYRSIDQINSELAWMNMLASSGLSVPMPVSATDGSMLQESNGVVTSMLSWLDGEPWSKLDLSPEQYHQLGCALARMHKLADNWALPTGFDRPTWDLIGDNPTWGRFWENPELSNDQIKRLLAFRDEARSIMSAGDSWDTGLIHADLVPDNVLSEGERLHFIDFDDGGFGYRLFDLATITHRSRRLLPDGDLAAAAVAGYGSVRAIESGLMNLFEAMRACSYVGWNMSRMNESGAAERNTRFIAETEQAIARFYGMSS